MVIEGLLRNQLFEPAVFFFQGLKPFQIAGCHPGIFGFPIVVGGFTHPVLSAELKQFNSSLGFFKYRDDLFLSLFLAYHVILPFVLL